MASVTSGTISGSMMQEKRDARKNTTQVTLFCTKCRRIYSHEQEEAPDLLRKYFCPECTPLGLVRERSSAREQKSVETEEEAHEIKRIETKKAEARKLLEQEYGTAFIVTREDLVDIAIERLVDECNNGKTENQTTEQYNAPEAKTTTAKINVNQLCYRVLNRKNRERHTEEKMLQAKIVDKGF